MPSLLTDKYQTTWRRTVFNPNDDPALRWIGGGKPLSPMALSTTHTVLFVFLPRILAVCLSVLILLVAVKSASRYEFLYWPALSTAVIAIGYVAIRFRGIGAALGGVGEWALQKYIVGRARSRSTKTRDWNVADLPDGTLVSMTGTVGEGDTFRSVVEDRAVFAFRINVSPSLKEAYVLNHVSDFELICASGVVRIEGVKARFLAPARRLSRPHPDVAGQIVGALNCIANPRDIRVDEQVLERGDAVEVIGSIYVESAIDGKRDSHRDSPVTVWIKSPPDRPMLIVKL